jgi:CBS domain-containing protein
MKVEDICTRDVKSCTRETPLADAGNLMWDENCDVLPVVDEIGKVLGVITDRDICMAAAVTRQPAPVMPVRVAFQPDVPACRLGDGVRDALRMMRFHKVRRLLVVDGAGILKGILTLTDVALAAKPDRVADTTDVSYEDLALAFKTIFAPRGKEADPVPAPETTTYV